ncbi:DUF169 domain-containing protein [Pseudonocardia spinosispora]|uniref:DUF169 domain-containing protein n=1 Tax=Pseudonocardia spinosispora TaxID=103441 RepID=UPI0004079B01|nr:DUF169 domain-containing protein [Pseudonocardia spinosispora]
MAPSSTAPATELARLLGLPHPPVALSFSDEPSADAHEDIPPQPAGCCFWEPAQRRALNTDAADHAHCSVGSYTHGFIPLDTAATGEDTAALVGSGWVTPADLAAAPHLPLAPRTIRYEPAADAVRADVVLLRLSATALMTLQGAWPALKLVTKPQCQIVPLAHGGDTAVSPGCAVSRVRTGLPADELTCALPAHQLPDIVQQLQRSVDADNAVSNYAAADRQAFEPLA